MLFCHANHRQYSWYVERDEVQSLLDWATQEQFGQVKNTSENHNTIQLLPSNVSTVQKKMIYCMDDTDAIKNMFELRYSGNEIRKLNYAVDCLLSKVINSYYMYISGNIVMHLRCANKVNY